MVLDYLECIPRPSIGYRLANYGTRLQFLGRQNPYAKKINVTTNIHDILHTIGHTYKSIHQNLGLVILVEVKVGLV